MNTLSTWGFQKKMGLSILLGLVSLLLCPYGIGVTLGNSQIDIPWSQLFPILATMAFGWRYGLLSGIAGGALFPFLLWPGDGWANVSTSAAYLILFVLLGIASDLHYFKRFPFVPCRVFMATLIYTCINYGYNQYIFNTMLSLNPSFWQADTISYFTPEILWGFLYKDTINVLVLALAANTILRLPVIRRLFGLKISSSMQANHFIFGSTLLIPIVVWLMYLGLDATLLRGHNALQYEHKSFALLVILANGFLVSRLLFYFSEKQYYTQSLLNASEQKYRLIFENAQDVFYQTDLDGNILDVSPSILTLAGYTQEEMIGTVSQCLYESTEQRMIQLHFMLKGGELRDHEITLHTKDGTFKHVSVNSRIIKDSNGNPHHIDGVLRDLTERKQNELEIETQNQLLQIKNKELEQFAYIASHDLQEPLQTLLSVSDLLQKEYSDKLDTQGHTYIGFIMQSAQRMQHLVKGLLDYARIGNVRFMGTVDCEQVVKKIVDELAPQVATCKAKITVHELPKVNGYANELEQLFLHLISNALKFSKNNSTVTVSISAEKKVGYWQFAVADNGIGIDQKDKEKIFIIFKRLHNRNEYDGTGIGLSYCKKIVALHGGNMWVESTLGEGSTFYFTIPSL